jgi:hypothetical protein
MTTVTITHAPLTIEDSLAAATARVGLAEGYTPRSQTAEPSWTRALDAGTPSTA